MKRILFTIAILSMMGAMSCDTNSPEPFDQATLFENGNNPFIGTWEAMGTFTTAGYDFTYIDTITFTESDYIEISETNRQGIFFRFAEYVGPYTYDEQFITGTYSYADSYSTKDLSGKTKSPAYPFGNQPFKFKDKNTLEYRGPTLLLDYIQNVVYIKK